MEEAVVSAVTDDTSEAKITVGGVPDRPGIAALRRQIVELEDRLKVLQARLEKEFPDYAALSNPKPLSAEEAQKLLGADAAMVFILPGDIESYLFALNRDAFE